MKKFALLLACAMLCTAVFASCAPSDSEDTETQDTEVEDTEAEDTEAEDTEAQDTEAQDTEAEDTEAQDTEAQDTEAEDTEAQDTTTVESYSNERLGLTFVPSENISILEMEGYDLWAQNSTTGSALFITVQEMDISEIPEDEIPEEGVDATMISTLVDLLKAQLDSQAEGVEYSQDFDIEFGAMSYVGFDYEMEMEGVVIYGSVLVGCEDGYLAAITLTGASEDDLMELLSCFDQELVVYEK